jgi:hypothetical protein
MQSMLPFKGKDPRDVRSSLLSVVMLGVLLLSVVVAWSLVARSSGSPELGREIMEGIRRDGLELLWRKQPAVQWYLTRLHRGDRTKDVGWRVTGIVRQEEVGGFRGLDVQHPAPGRSGIGHVETWTLNAKATEGSYEAYKLTIGEKTRRFSFSARITLKDGTVLLQQPGGVVSSADVPPHYAPEGTLPLACFLAAKR